MCIKVGVYDFEADCLGKEMQEERQLDWNDTSVVACGLLYDVIATTKNELSKMPVPSLIFNKFPALKPYAQPELKSNVVSNRFLDYNISEDGEFEYELQRLQLYLDGEDAFGDAQQEIIE
ncbi:hypothetical protein L195_g035120, partial [Trifolium pratense]